MSPLNHDQNYHEKLSSGWTEALFLGLMLLFGGFFAWRVRVGSLDAIAFVLLCLFGIFLFYVINYRTLSIQITPVILQLRFGIFTWTERLQNIDSSAVDKLPFLLKYGGAGIHFMTVHARYRASFNFLEHPRVLLALKQKRGFVRDLSFSTRQPEQIIQYLRNFGITS